MKKFLIFSGLCGLGLFVVIFTMSSRQSAQANSSADTSDATAVEEKKATVYSVDLTVAESRSMTTFVASTATLRADRSVDIFSKVAGQVESLPVEEGDAVEAGTLLLELDGDDERLKMEESKVLLDRAHAEFERIKKSYRNQLVSTDAFEAKKYELDKAQAAFDLARYSYEQNRVLAPFDGTIVERNVEVGQTIQMSDKLFRLSALNPLEADVFLPESQTQPLRAGMRVELSAKDDFTAPFSGEIARIAPVVDQETGTVKVTVAIFNAPEAVRPGSYVHLHIITSESVQPVVVPKKSLIFDNRQKAYVFVIDEVANSANQMRVKRVAVQTGIEEDGFVSLTNGLDAGQQVVLTGKESLKNGALIQAVNTETPIAAN